MRGKRLRDFGLAVGRLPAGKENAITDVAGVKVGHVTLSSTSGFAREVCTGVTAVVAHPGDLFQEKRIAAAHVINGYGKTTGLVQVGELGLLESPILLTNTFSVPAVTEGVLRAMMQANPDIGDGGPSLNVVVAECNDSYLNDMRGMHVRPEHAMEAVARARGGPVEEGAVGAGKGMRCFGWKGGIGTASRRIPDTPYAIGALVLTNFGSPEDLTILGHPVGRTLLPSGGLDKPSDGSVIVVLATDLPFDALQLGRLARRTAFGLARTGSIASHGSGDIAIAFSTAVPGNRASTHRVSSDQILNLAFRAVVEATEEAVLNSLTAAETTEGRRGRVVPALPMDQVSNLLRQAR